MYKKVVHVITLLVFLTSQIGYSCDKPVTYLEKETVAPCTGYLFSPQKELEVRLIVQNQSYIKQENELLNKKVQLLMENSQFLEEIVKKEQEKAELWRVRAIESTEKLVASEEGRGKRDWLFLISGVVLTVAAGFAVGQAK